MQGVILLILVTSLAVGATSCSRNDMSATAAGGAGAAPSARGVPVSLATVQRKAMPLQLRVVGTVEASYAVAVRPQVSGELRAVNFEEGQDVTEGQVLFEIDRRPLEAALKQAQANLERDIAQSANAEAQANRYDDLARRGIATREQVETLRTEAAALAAVVNADRAAVEQAAVQLEYATIKAPIVGRTGTLFVHPGNLVRPNDTTPLVVINRISPVNVAFGVPEGQLASLRQHMAAGTTRVEAEIPNDSRSASVGRINFIDNAVDQATGTIKVKGTFSNEGRRLWPGQYVNVIVTLDTEPNALVVPTVAVQTSQNGQYVFVVMPDQTVDLRPVSITRSIGLESVIQGKVTEGDTVVTDGHLRLTPGSHIVAKTPDSEEATP
jgi:multidrug efflux system membrane fusion protein